MSGQLIRYGTKVVSIGSKNISRRKISVGGLTIQIGYLYNNSAGDVMRLTDTGTEGLSDFKASIEAMTDSNSNSYVLTEIDSSTWNPVTDLGTYDVIITGSDNRVYNGTEQTAFDDWVRAGGGIFGYSDSAMGASGGYQNQFGQASRHSMGFPLWGWQVYVDQVDGVQTRTLPAGHIFGDGLQFQGEGTSPWVSHASPDPSMGNPTTVNARPDQTPNHTAGITYAGTVTDLGYSTPGSGRVAVLFDRQPFWNGGAGSDFSQVSNETVLQNIIKWLAGYS